MILKSPMKIKHSNCADVPVHRHISLKLIFPAITGKHFCFITSTLNKIV